MLPMEKDTNAADLANTKSLGDLKRHLLLRRLRNLRSGDASFIAKLLHRLPRGLHGLRHGEQQVSPRSSSNAI